MQKGIGYGALGAGRYGMSGGIGIRPPRAAGPAIPAFDNVDGCWALFNWNPVVYVEGTCVEGAVDGSSAFLGTEPYENNWATLVSGDQDLVMWSDSSSNSNSFSARGTAPILDVTNKAVSFDSTGGLRSASSIQSSTTKTYYVLFRVDNIVNDDILFQIGDVDSVAGAINVEHKKVPSRVEATLRIDISTVTMISAPLPDTEWHLLCITVDSENATVADQFNIYVDNVEGDANITDLVDVPTVNELLYAGGNVFESWRCQGAIRMIRINNQVDSPEVRAAMYERVQYLQGIA